MKVKILHSDCCPKCEEIIWTQTDDKTGRKHRPNLKCQCYCGHTMINDKKTEYGGGKKFSKSNLKKRINEAHLFIEREGENITIE